MKLYDMLEMHNPPESIGDCMRACTATLLGVPPETLPHFARWHWDEGATPDEVHQRWREYLVEHHGVDVILLQMEGQDPRHLPQALCIGIGQSPRFSGAYHDVLWMMDENGGAMIHDPHPSRAGVGDIPELVCFIVPVNAGAAA